ncbi:MAG: hypothetical protein M1813_007252 [Trichoglossum hirsutum]|nr:MAG: hypothetical protein M1813_007252 [Trichoglossum hirsutum]
MTYGSGVYGPGSHGSSVRNSPTYNSAATHSTPSVSPATPSFVITESSVSPMSAIGSDHSTTVPSTLTSTNKGSTTTGPSESISVDISESTSAPDSSTTAPDHGIFTSCSDSSSTESVDHGKSTSASDGPGISPLGSSATVSTTKGSTITSAGPDNSSSGSSGPEVTPSNHSTTALTDSSLTTTAIYPGESTSISHTTAPGVEPTSAPDSSATSLESFSNSDSSSTASADHGESTSTSTTSFSVLGTISSTTEGSTTATASSGNSGSTPYGSTATSLNLTATASTSDGSTTAVDLGGSTSTSDIITTTSLDTEKSTLASSDFSTSALTSESSTSTPLDLTTPPASTTAASSITSALPLSGSYNPPIPTSYTDCYMDPSLDPFELLDPNSGIPIVNKSGKAGLATEVSSDAGTYRFVSAASAPSGVYDLLYENSQGSAYFAIFLNGDVGFRPSSSNGQEFITDGTGQYITTIWSIACDGGISAGIINGAEFIFSIDDSTGNLFADTTADPSLRRRDVVGRIVKVIAFLQKIFTSGDSQRCENPDTHAADKTGAREKEANQCGSGELAGWIPPNLEFSKCCDDHDICFDTCEEQFASCNNIFLGCNIQVCRSNHEAGSIVEWGCEKLANLYGYAVTTFMGKAAFVSATDDRCECKCNVEGMTLCDDKCVDLTADEKNCGSCGNICPLTLSCINSACDCKDGFSLCEDTCMELSSDPQNCGICGNIVRSSFADPLNPCRSSRFTFQAHLLEGGVEDGKPQSPLQESWKYANHVFLRGPTVWRRADVQ